MNNQLMMNWKWDSGQARLTFLRGTVAYRAASSSKRELLRFMELLKPKSTGINLVQVGSAGDGGYIVPNDFDEIGFCFSPGVSAVSMFEQQIAAFYSIKSFMADASVEGPPIESKFFTFLEKVTAEIPESSFGWKVG